MKADGVGSDATQDPVPDAADPEARGADAVAPDAPTNPDEPPPRSAAEAEEEVKALRWELEETRRAAQSSPFSRDFLRLSAVIASKERQIVALKKELWARDHKIASGSTALRELSTRALKATRERDVVSGRTTQLERDLEAEQNEVLRLRRDLQRHVADSEQAAASLVEERRQHDETRRSYAAALLALEQQLRE